MKKFEEAEIEVIHIDEDNIVATSGLPPVTCCQDGYEMPKTG